MARIGNVGGAKSGLGVGIGSPLTVEAAIEQARDQGDVRDDGQGNIHAGWG